MVNPFEETLQAGRIDPREQSIMQQGIGTLRPQLEDTGYSIGNLGIEDAEDNRSFFQKIHDKFGINKDNPYHNPPEKTTAWNKPNSWFSSQFMPYAIAAGLRDWGNPDEFNKFQKFVEEGKYKAALAEKGLPFNEYPPSTFTPGMSRYENKFGFNVDLGDLFGLNLGDFNLSYDYDLDDERSLLQLLYNLKF